MILRMNFFFYSVFDTRAWRYEYGYGTTGSMLSINMGRATTITIMTH